MPKSLREPKTQRELALMFGVGEDTLSEWKTRDGFWDLVASHRNNWGREKTPEVLLSLFERATKTGDPRVCALWFEVVEGHDEDKSHVCSRCERSAQYESMSDDEMFALLEHIKKQQDFFAKR